MENSTDAPRRLSGRSSKIFNAQRTHGYSATSVSMEQLGASAAPWSASSRGCLLSHVFIIYTVYVTCCQCFIADSQLHFNGTMNSEHPCTFPCTRVLLGRSVAEMTREAPVSTLDCWQRARCWLCEEPGLGKLECTCTLRLSKRCCASCVLQTLPICLLSLFRGPGLSVAGPCRVCWLAVSP